MFLGNTKDLKKGEALRPRGRKPAPKTASSTSGSVPAPAAAAESSVGSKEVDVVAQATAAREERARQRDLFGYATKMQALLRGFTARSLNIKRMRSTFDSKMSDLVKLSQLLGARGVAFCPPPNVVVELMCSLFIMGHKEGTTASGTASSKSRITSQAVIAADMKRIVLFCKFVLNPSLAQADPAKNVILLLSPEISFGTNVKVSKLVRGIFRALDPASIKLAALSSQDELDESLLRTITLLLTGGSSSSSGSGSGKEEGSGCNEMENAFRRLQGTLMEQAVATGGSTFLDYAHTLLGKYTTPLLRAMDPEASSSGGGGGASIIEKAKFPYSEQVSRVVFEACLLLLEKDSSSSRGSNSKQQQGGAGARTERFYWALLGCPMLTLLLPPSVRQTFAKSRHFSNLLRLTLSPAGRRAPYAVGVVTDQYTAAASMSAFEPGHWVQGNVFHLGASVGIIGTINAVTGADMVDEMGDEELLCYLQCCLRLMCSSHLPQTFHGKATVLWTKRGRSGLVATGMPLGLQNQLEGLVQKEVLLALYTRVLVPVREDAATYAGLGPKGAKRLEADAREVQDALKRDGRAIASAALEEQQKEAASWFTGKWATKVMKQFNKALGLGSDGKPLQNDAAGGGGGGSNASTAAMAAAVTAADNEGSTDGLYAPLPETTFRESPPLVEALLHLWAVILPQIAQPAAVPRSGGGSNSAAAKKAAPGIMGLTTLVFQTRVTDRLWVVCQKYGGDKVGLQAAADSFCEKISSSAGAARDLLVPQNTFLAAVTCFSATLRVCLGALDDQELYGFGRPLPLAQMLGVVRVCKKVVYAAISLDPAILVDGTVATASGGSSPVKKAAGGGGGDATADSGGLSAGAKAFADSMDQHSQQFAHFTAKTLSAVLRDLHSMWSRRAFSEAGLWAVKDADSAAIRSALRADFWAKNSLARALLFHVPGAVTFHERMKLFREIMDLERFQIQGDPNPNSGARRPAIVFQVRRKYLLEDGMKAMEKVTGANIKMRVQIQYINEYGEAEAGIDIGGLFKDFVTELSDRIFDPNYGLFCTTEENLLYPNPAATALYGEDELSELFSFLGRVLGKALYENITLQPQFAHFFLAFMHGRYNFQHMFSDLVTLDPELHKNLLFLKNYEGDVADLCLTFSISDTSLGGSKERPLIPGGDSVDVTSANRHQYIHAVAKYYLHDQLRSQAGAFFHGLYQACDRDLLGMFSAPELQVLISGASSGINVGDLKANCRYNGYTGVDRTMSNFWSVFENEMTERDRALLVKFVTSCERPPSLGFSSLDPPFCIQRGPVDDTRLPTASTCFNVLKLPVYSSKAALREKLLTAIRSGSGFELS